MLTVRTTCFPTADIAVKFAPHPHRRGLADQSGQIPARVLQPSHNTQKNRATRLLTATDAMQRVTAALRGAERGSTLQVGPRSPAQRRSGSSLPVKGAARRAN
jgi:hypothetical protein